MIIKKFVGKTEADAVEAARKELGPGIVIMNVKVVNQKGLMAIFGSKKTEVTVALEEENDTRQTVRRDPPSPKGQSVKQEYKHPVSLSADVTAENSQSIEQKLDSLQTLLVSRFQQNEAERKDSLVNGDASGETEVEEEKAEEKFSSEVTEQERFVRLLYNTMLENEVNEKYANQIVDDIDLAGQPNVPFDYILANVYQKMILKFGKAEGITPAETKPKIVLFMGPTGVGKTTTIAKIASSYAVEEQKKVALLTADTYRIAAVEQLRIYANILEVPFRVIYSEEEAKEAIREFEDYDYIFVDTAGHSHQNEEQLENMKKMIEAVVGTGECQNFLVLSATTKYRDLLKIVSTYDAMGDFQLIFTKLDETDTLGNLLNLKLYMDTPIAFVTYGQNVPSDIEQFNPQKVVKQILSTRHEKSS